MSATMVPIVESIAIADGTAEVYGVLDCDDAIDSIPGTLQRMEVSSYLGWHRVVDTGERACIECAGLVVMTGGCVEEDHDDRHDPYTSQDVGCEVGRCEETPDLSTAVGAMCGGAAW